MECVAESNRGVFWTRRSPRVDGILRGARLRRLLASDKLFGHENLQGRLCCVPTLLQWLAYREQRQGGGVDDEGSSWESEEWWETRKKMGRGAAKRES